MKLDVFNKYVEQVADLYGLKKEELFLKSKRKDIVEPRHLLICLCNRRGISFTYTKIYMEMYGYKLIHSSYRNSLIHSENKMKDDEDYVYILKRIENSVFI
jgi:hypothetical protein